MSNNDRDQSGFSSYLTWGTFLAFDTLTYKYWRDDQWHQDTLQALLNPKSPE